MSHTERGILVPTSANGKEVMQRPGDAIVRFLDRPSVASFVSLNSGSSYRGPSLNPESNILHLPHGSAAYLIFHYKPPILFKHLKKQEGHDIGSVHAIIGGELEQKISKTGTPYYHADDAERVLVFMKQYSTKNHNGLRLLCRFVR